MKKWKSVLFAILTIAIILGSSGSFAAAAAAPAAGEPQFGGPVVEIGVFRERLAPYGRWFTIPSYGYVWSPFNVAAGWGPYLDGTWEYTDAGWTWISDDPWGWATCHYGRWFLDSAYGWAWVPGAEWAPAWVDWMYGDGFIGWAPLSPAFVGIGGFVPIPVRFFRFCRDRDFDHPHVGRFIVPVGRNAELFAHSQRVTHFERAGGVVINRSFSRETIERAAGHLIQQRALNGVNSPHLNGVNSPQQLERRSNRGLDRTMPSTPNGAARVTQRLERQQAAEQERAARQQQRQADRQQFQMQQQRQQQMQQEHQMMRQPRMQAAPRTQAPPPRQMQAPRQPMMGHANRGGGNGEFRRR